MTVIKRNVFLRNGPETQSGFTLLEVLVSLSILGIAVVVILQLFSVNLKSISLSEDYVRGAVEAEAKMREILDSQDFTEKSWNGRTENGHRFEASVANVLTERTDNLQVKMVEISVTVYWTEAGKERSSILKTLKVNEKKV
jgi:prepilin-type N-terminal cleavage/methylation domain-containing protein